MADFGTLNSDRVNTSTSKHTKYAKFGSLGIKSFIQGGCLAPVAKFQQFFILAETHDANLSEKEEMP